MSHDTLLHGLVRPVVRRLARTSVRPDHLTGLRFATAVVAAIAFAWGDPLWRNVGAAVFVLSCLLDRADGELARQTKRFSTHGHRYDLLADWSANAMAFIGIGVGALGGPLGWAAPILGLLAAAGVTIVFYVLHARGGAPGQPRMCTEGRRILVDPDDAILFVPLLLWTCGPATVLLAAGTVTPLLAMTMILRPGRSSASAGGRVT